MVIPVWLGKSKDKTDKRVIKGQVINGQQVDIHKQLREFAEKNPNRMAVIEIRLEGRVEDE